MKNQNQNLTAKNRFDEINQEINQMIEKIKNTQEQNTKKQDVNWANVSEAAATARYLEETLGLMGALDEKDFKYAK